MKHSEKLAVILTYGLPLLLCIPNFALSIVGRDSLPEFLANCLLPLGLLLMLFASNRRIGLTVLCCFPLMILAAFQIVLLFLYTDASVIGEDMFLNVVTTNVSEANELLGGLRLSVIAVVVFYLLPLVAAVYAVYAKIRTPATARKPAMFGGLILSIVGAVSLLKIPDYRIKEDLYPVNVLCNLQKAIVRTNQFNRYEQTCCGFSYGAESMRSPEIRELYIAVVGETARASNWQLFGYNRFTTPGLCALKSSSFVAYGNALSESNTTHKSVPLMLTMLTSETFADSINATKSIITAFAEAGFATDVVSMQCRAGSYIDYFVAEADNVVYLREPSQGNIIDDVYDLDMLSVVDSIIAREANKQLIVLHQYGCHFNYFDRYPRSAAFFLPDRAADVSASNRTQLINAYDNAIRQTDELLCSLIERIDSVGCFAGLIYSSDHGEDIFDDAQCRFLHSSPIPTHYQLHVPVLMYISQALYSREPKLVENALRHTRETVSASLSFAPTLIHIAGLKSPRLNEQHALTSEKYLPPQTHLFLSDCNRAMPLHELGVCYEPIIDNSNHSVSAASNSFLTIE